MPLPPAPAAGGTAGRVSVRRAMGRRRSPGAALNPDRDQNAASSISIIAPLPALIAT
jgi:hypothetical protein